MGLFSVVAVLYDSEQMFDSLTVEERSVDSLERDLLASERRVAGKRARQVELLRRLDVAQVAAADGCKSLADWVASRLDLSHRIVRDLMVVARAEDDRVDRLLERARSGWSGRWP